MPVPPQVTGYTSLTQQARLCLENNAGEQLLMPLTNGAATMSLITQPNAAGAATTGMHLHLYFLGQQAGGTVVISGTAPGGGSITSRTYHIGAAPLNDQGYVEIVTTEAFATVSANGIAVSGITSFQVIVFGSPAAKYLIPLTLEPDEKITKFSPQDHRGILFKNLRVTQLTKGASLDKVDASLYSGPSSLWIPYTLIGNTPVITTAPASPSSLLTATTLAATMTLTTAPKNPGMFLIFTPAGNSATGTIVLSGLDQNGNAASETINVGANNNPVYSTKRYSALTSPATNQFTTTGMTAGSTLAVTGVFAWIYTWTYDGITNITPFSATWEFFDGVANVKLPYSILTQGDFDWQKEKEIKFSGKGEAQDYLIVGDPTSTSAGTLLFSTLAQPTDKPMISWPGTFFMDALPGGTPFTTQTGEFLTFKLQIMNGQKPFWVGDGMQRWSNVTRDYPDYTFDATVLFQNYQEYLTYYKPNAKFVAGVQFQGGLLGSLAGTNYFEYWKFSLPAKYDTYKVDSSKNPVEVAVKGISEYDFGLGYAYQLAVCCQVPPTYTS